MIYRPSKKDREMILENVANIDPLEKTVKPGSLWKISPDSHIHENHKDIVLYQAAHIKKILGRGELKLLYNKLKEKSCFEYEFAKQYAVSLGFPAEVITEFLKRRIIERTKSGIKKQQKNHFHSCISCHNKVPTGEMRLNGLCFLISDSGPLYCDYAIRDFKNTRNFDISILDRAISLVSSSSHDSKEPFTLIISSIGYKIESKLLSDIFKKLRNSRIREKLKKRKLCIVFTVNYDSLSREIIMIIKKYKAEIFLCPGNYKNTEESNDSGFDSSYFMTIYSILKENKIRFTSIIPIEPDDRNKAGKIIAFFRDNCIVMPMRFYMAPFSKNGHRHMTGKEASDLYIDTIRMLMENGMSDGNIGRKILSFVNEFPLFTKCAMLSGVLFINAKGNIGSCPGLLNRGIDTIGNINDADIENKCLKKCNTKTYKSMVPVFQKECRGCIGLGLCGGKCRFLALEEIKNSIHSDDFHCDFVRGLTKNLLDETIYLNNKVESADKKEKINAKD